MKKMSLKTRGHASAYDIKEKYVFDEIESATSSNLREARKTAMRKLIKGITPVCSIYEVDSRKLTEKHERFTTEGVSGKGILFLAKPLCNGRTDRNDDHAMCDVLCLSSMMDMTRIMGDMMRLGAYSHFFSSILQFSLPYEAFRIEKREINASNRAFSK